ncbi:hypothetical protein BDV96DRAFT_629147 [Lophiotrema nucula]|uniref:Uncharacterized protein n=1 Tax=Lophiotrema nucula TaxID=690887 RepID=A0A6A5ZKR4_9PLEO|nr:hypothetical protein BDV96DRAFT_629147 [Lophiotrema nucula]
MSGDNSNRSQQTPASSGSGVSASQTPTVGASTSGDATFSLAAFDPFWDPNLDPSLFTQGADTNPQPAQSEAQQWNRQRQPPTQQPRANVAQPEYSTPLSPLYIPEDPSLPGPAGAAIIWTGQVGQGFVQPRGENRHAETYESVRNQLYGEDLAPANFLVTTRFRLPGQPLWGQTAPPFVPGAPVEDVPQNAAAAREFLNAQIIWRPSAAFEGVPNHLDTDLIRYFGNEMAIALAGMRNVLDREPNPASYRRFLPVEQGGLWSWPRIVAIAHHIVGLAIRMHQEGTSNPVFFIPEHVPTGVDEAFDFRARLEAFMNLVRRFKSCADTVMQGNHIESWLANPVKTLDTKQHQLVVWQQRRLQRHQQTFQQANRQTPAAEGIPPMRSMVPSASGSQLLPTAGPQPHATTSPSPHPTRKRSGMIDFNQYTDQLSAAQAQQSPFHASQNPLPTNAYYEAGYRPTGFGMQGPSTQPQHSNSPHPGMTNPSVVDYSVQWQGQQHDPRSNSAQALTGVYSPAVAAPAPRAPSRATATQFDYNLQFLRDPNVQVPRSASWEGQLDQFHAQYEESVRQQRLRLQLEQQQQQDQSGNGENAEGGTRS